MKTGHMAASQTGMNSQNNAGPGDTQGIVRGNAQDVSFQACRNILEIEEGKQLSSQFLYCCFLTYGHIQDMGVSLNKTPQYRPQNTILLL